MLWNDRYTDADPFKLIYVDPELIQNRVTNLPAVWGQVIGGEWQTDPIADEPKYQAIKQHFQNEVPWSSLGELEYNVSDAQVWDEIYLSIRQEGYKTQAELTSDTDESELTWDSEVGVAIDANGEIHWIIRGSHRVRLAKIVGINALPVQVRVRHTKWQELRDEIRRVGSADDLSDRARNHLYHPDMEDIRTMLE